MNTGRETRYADDRILKSQMGQGPFLGKLGGVNKGQVATYAQPQPKRRSVSDVSAGEAVAFTLQRRSKRQTCGFLDFNKHSKSKSSGPLGSAQADPPTGLDPHHLRVIESAVVGEIGIVLDIVEIHSHVFVHGHLS